MFNEGSVRRAQNTQHSNLRPDWALPHIREIGAPFIDIPSSYIEKSYLSEGASALLVVLRCVLVLDSYLARASSF